MTDLRAWAANHARTLGRTGIPAGSPAAPAAAPLRITVRERLVLEGHAGEVLTIVSGVLPDGSIILASGAGLSNRSILLWDPAKGRLRRMLTEGRTLVYCLALTTMPNGSVIMASGNTDRTVQLWDPVAGTHLQTFTGHTNSVWDVAFAELPDGSPFLASRSDDHTVRLWDPRGRRYLRTLEAGSGVTYGMAIGVMPDGVVAVAAGQGHAIRLWDADNGRELNTFTPPKAENVWALEFVAMPDGSTYLIVGYDGGGICLLNPTTGEVVGELSGHTARLYTLRAFTAPDGTPILASDSSDGTVRLWNLRDRSCLATVPQRRATGGRSRISVATLADGQVILATARDGRAVQVWNLDFSPAARPDPPRRPTVSVGSEPIHFVGHRGGVASLDAGTLNGSATLISGSWDQTVRLWNPATGQLRSVEDNQVTRDAAVAIGPDDLIAVRAHSTGGVLVTDKRSGQRLREFRAHSDNVNALAFATRPDGAAIVASGGDDNRALIWNPVTARHHHTLSGHTDTVRSVAFGALPDATVLLATGSTDNTVRLWDATTGRHLRTLVCGAWVRSVAFGRLRDGTTVVAAGSADGAVRLWGAATGRHLRTLTHGDKWVCAVTFVTLPGDVTVLASGGYDHTVRLWDTDSWTTITTLEHPDDVLSLAAAALPDGSAVLISGCRDGTLLGHRLRAQFPEPPAASEAVSVGPALRASVAGLVGLASAGVTAPLGLLVDLIALTGGATPADELLQTLADAVGVCRLRELGWPRAARVGLAALLLDELPADPRYAAPPAAAPGQLRDALLDALASPPAETRPDHAATVADLRRAADRITERTVSLLAIVGPDAVAVDPVLPLRLRDRVDHLPHLGAVPRTLLAQTVSYLERRPSAHAGSAMVAAGTTGISLRGGITNLLHTELALPDDLFTLRYVRGDVLYRLHDGHVEPRLDPVTIVLDTTPPTFGPVETVLRLVAHALAVAVWAAQREVALVCLDAPDRVVPLARPADLVALWSSRTLAAPALAEALATAARRRTRTVVLTHHHLAREHPLVASSGLRVLTTHLPGDPPQRPPASPFHIHLPPRPTRTDLLRAVLNLLVPSPPATGELVLSRDPTWSRPARTSPRRSLPDSTGSEDEPLPDLNQLLSGRVVALEQEIDDDVANRICAQLLMLAAENPDQDIVLRINSPGGSVTAGMAIYDTIQFIDCEVVTLAFGTAGGMAQFVLSAGARGKRYAVTGSWAVLSAPSAGPGGTAADIAVQAQLFRRHRQEMAQLIAGHTGQPVEQIMADWDPERTFSAEEAREYGIVDHVLAAPSPPERTTPDATASRPAGGFTIAQAVVDAIVAHARRDHPDMACGLVTGPIGSTRPERHIPMGNAARSPTVFEMDNHELLRVYRELEERGEEVVAIYRSYTATEAYPSGMDIRLADPDAYQIIVSTRDPDVTEFRCYRIVDGHVVEVPVRIV